MAMTGRGAKFGLPAAASIWSDRTAMRVWAMAGLLMFGGCFSDLGSGLVGSTAGGEGTSSSGEPTSSSSSSSSGGETTMAPTTGEPPLPATCDPFEQDCPDGAKCAPYVEGEGLEWNANKCVPVTGDGTPGEACTFESPQSGEDSCAKGNFCTSGVCVTLCGGTEEAPACPQSDVCLIGNDGVLNLCVSGCDPLDPKECLAGQVCVEDAGPGSSQKFVCFEGGGLSLGGACMYLNDCDPGLFCGNSVAPYCKGDSNQLGCCLQYCGPDAAIDCPVDTVCVPFDPVDDEYPALGYCGVSG